MGPGSPRPLNFLIFKHYPWRKSTLQKLGDDLMSSVKVVLKLWAAAPIAGMGVWFPPWGGVGKGFAHDLLITSLAELARPTPLGAPACVEAACHQPQ